MVRAFIYILASIFAITFIRMVIGLLTRGVGDLLNAELKNAPQKSSSGGPVPTSGELKPCAKCGTYVLATTPFRGVSSAGDPVFFCSQACQRNV